MPQESYNFQDKKVTVKPIGLYDYKLLPTTL